MSENGRHESTFTAPSDRRRRRLFRGHTRGALPGSPPGAGGKLLYLPPRPPS
jgi:hypothetical protein